MSYCLDDILSCAIVAFGIFLAVLSARFVCCCKMDVVAVDLFNNSVNCSNPFLVESPSCKIGAVSFGGLAKSVEIFDIDCQMKSSIVLEGIRIVCGIKLSVSASISVLVCGIKHFIQR